MTVFLSFPVLVISTSTTMTPLKTLVLTVKLPFTFTFGPVIEPAPTFGQDAP